VDIVGAASLSQTGLMREMKRSALVARPAELVYRLVEDVERYPEFVPGCSEAKVLERSATEMVARLSVRRGPLRTAFTTPNRLNPGRGVKLDLIEGPFSMLEGEWTFTPIAEQGCRIELRMRFQFSNILKAALFEPLFEETAASLVRAFVSRAQSTPG
jgi:ribosome-associated toxin RatA of RatAB toxin-antitoxin module